ncbi:uncharacterized protein LOC124279482 [Haliotis rubra]|uniref:uncharacterized protein LOC124279482 n=1 Tax=Haliotis rubra TaxID=36100 RepID=UPI001EE627B1|nr:uncharacterized protein LOC124279482 [Haliotis rubra]
MVSLSGPHSSYDPSFTMTCSQVSTPGITVDDLQAIRKKSSGRRGSKAGFSIKLDNGHLIKKQTIPKPITYRQSMEQSKGNVSRVTSSPDGGGIGSLAETVLSGETDTHSGVDVAITCMDNISQKAHCCHDAGKGFSNSSAAVDAIGGNNKPGYREKLHSVRNSLPQAAMKKRKQAALASKDVTAKRPKHVTKDTVRTKTVLDKYFKTYTHCTKSGHSPKKNDLKKSHRETDQIVLVNQDDYVYRDADWPPGRMRDAYDFIPSSPEKNIAQTTRVRENRRKEQVRLQVLKTIYKIETELAVLRHRRKHIKEKLTREDRTTTLTFNV